MAQGVGTTQLMHESAQQEDRISKKSYLESFRGKNLLPTISCEKNGEALDWFILQLLSENNFLRAANTCGDYL